MRILDKNTPCPDCGTGMCYVKEFRDGHTNYFCGCRQSVWQEEYYETPCTNTSCAALRAEVERYKEAVEWALDNVSRMDHDEAFTFKAELHRKAKEGK